MTNDGGLTFEKGLGKKNLQQHLLNHQDPKQVHQLKEMIHHCEHAYRNIQASQDFFSVRHLAVKQELIS